MRYCAVSVYYPLNPVAGDTRGALEPRVYRSLARVARLTEFQKKSFVRSEVNCWMDVIKKKQQQTLFCYLLLSLDFISLKKKGKSHLPFGFFTVSTSRQILRIPRIPILQHYYYKRTSSSSTLAFKKYQHRDLYHLSWLNSREVYFIFLF